ncbi:MAG: N-acetylneuraminate synthase family protein [Bdellovibrionota bacterium]
MTSHTASRCSQEIHLNRWTLSEVGPVFIIAEIGVNHNGDLELAKQMVRAAKAAGADAVKFQTFQTDRLVTKTASMAKYQERNTGVKETQFEMLKRLELSEDDHRELAALCASLDAFFLSTPFDPPSVDLLNRIGVEAFKISSSDTDNFPLLSKIGRERKPMILSTGMSVLDDVGAALDLLLPLTQDIVVLQCTSEYPCPPEEAHLAAMCSIRERFGCLVGFSDHTLGSDGATLAALLGACLIEKHFTVDRTLPGPDQVASSLPEEFAEMVRRVREVDALSPAERKHMLERFPDAKRYLGSPEKKLSRAVVDSGVSAVAKKSVVAAERIARGTVIEEHMLTVKRPGTGIAPVRFNELIGRRASRDIAVDELLSWEDLQPIVGENGTAPGKAQ